MKNAKVENRKGNKEIVQSRRVAGVPVRSGVKAGKLHDFGHFGEPGKPGKPGGPGVSAEGVHLGF